MGLTRARKYGILIITIEWQPRHPLEEYTMPISPSTRAATNVQPTQPVPQPPHALRVPQARILSALLPPYPDDPPSEWPLVTRQVLARRAGYTPISGTINRVLHGIPPGSSSGEPHPGLLDLKLIEKLKVDVDGVSEDNYRITPEGIRAIQHYFASGKRIPELRNREYCINDRYKKADNPTASS